MTGMTIDGSQTNGVEIRRIEQSSIHRFLFFVSEYLSSGRVLDYGCGRVGTCKEPEPYKSLVESLESEYVGWDPVDGPLGGVMGTFSAILCTQAIHYSPSPILTLQTLGMFLPPGGHIVMTYPTTWAELTEEGMMEIYRITRGGMEVLLKASGFKVVVHEERARIVIPGFSLALGYGVVGRKL